MHSQVNTAVSYQESPGNHQANKQHTIPIIEALKKMGLEVSLGKRNELLLGAKKISGTASHVFKKRVLHHGTLLFCSEMQDLSRALKVRTGKFEDRAVKSIRSEVTNINEHLSEKMEIDDFQKLLLESVLESLDGKVYQYSEEDIKQINELRNSKFSTWEWNFGYSPRYQFNKTLRSGEKEIAIHMNVEKGVILEINIEGNFMSSRNIYALEKILAGAIHDPHTIRMRLSGIKVEEYIEGLENEMLISGLF